MASADLLQELNDDLVKAYSSVQSKGGTVPEHKNSNNLSTAIDSITGGGSTPSHDIPEFDGGEYGAIAYLLPGETEIKYYTAKTADELKVNSSSPSTNSITVTLEDGTPIFRYDVLAYSIGSADTHIGAAYFLGYFSHLEKLYGLERYTGNIVGDFLYHCYAFNHPIVLSSSTTSVGQYFMNNCYSFNQRIVMPSVKTIGMGFLQNTSAFNQSIDLPELTTISDYFLSYGRSFNQPLNLPKLATIGSNFLQNCSSFNQPLSLPALTNTGSSFLNICESFNQPLNLPLAQTIGNNFLNGCSSFNQPLSLPVIQEIGYSFLQNCYSFNQPLSLSSSITSIGTGFLKNCYSFVSPLNVGTTTPPTDNESLSAPNTTPAYTIGITITGANAQAWKDALPDRDTSPYRKLILGGGLTYQTP